MTPSLNKSFKFQSDWPYNNSQVYLLNSILEDLKEDDDRTFQSTDNGFVFTSDVHYPNNKLLDKQNVYMDKDSKITKVEVVDDDNNILISMTYSQIEYDKKFDDNYFELNSIINTNNKENSTDSLDKENKDIEKNSTSKKDDNITDDNITDDNSNNKENSTTTNNNDTHQNTKETMSIDDVIYPMYLPDNTYLIGQDRIDTDGGERLILTFGGDNSFVLVEETTVSNDDNLVIPVSGEFGFLSDVIGVISEKSIMWHSNGIDYYLTSNSIETSTLVDIARSISVLPVSK